MPRDATLTPRRKFPSAFLEGLEQAGAQYLRATRFERNALRCYVLTRDPHSSVGQGHILILEDDNLDVLAVVTLGRVHHLQQQWAVYEATAIRRGAVVSGAVQPQPDCLVCVPFRCSRVTLWHAIEYRARFRALPSTIQRSGCVCRSSCVQVVVEAPGTASMRTHRARRL